MGSWLGQLRDELIQLKQDTLFRHLREFDTSGLSLCADGDAWINLASNDYLGLSQHPRLKRAAIEAVESFGTGSGASRLVSGSFSFHARTERRFAQFKHAEAGLLFPSGYVANLAVLGALAGRGDVICLDKLCHASLIDAARLSGAAVRVFPHGHTAKLVRVLERHAQSNPTKISGHKTRRFIVTDSVFSMDGDTADLPKLCDIADRYDAILVVDEAHATGVLGETGSGLCQLQDVSERVGVVVSTASKALGAAGGIVTAKRVVIDTIINRGRPFIYTTAVPPATAAAIDAALDIIRDEPWRRQRLRSLCQLLFSQLKDIGWADCLPPYWDAKTPIFSLIVGENQAALALSDHLLQHGFYTPAIRPPTVANGAARVRISLRADLSDDHLQNLISALISARCSIKI